MKIAIFNPYNIMSPEMPALALLSSYLTEFGHDILSLQCDGCFSVCDRAATPEGGLRRRFSECFGCQGDANILSPKSFVTKKKVSSYLSEDDVFRTYRWAQTFDFAEVGDVEFEGENVLWLCRNSLKARYGTVDGCLKLPGIEPQIRQLFLSAIRALKIGQRLMETSAPEILLVSGRDLLAEALEVGQKKVGGMTTRFVWQPKLKLLNVAHPQRNEVLSLDTAVITPTVLISDSRNWPEEVTKLVNEITTFLEIPSSQLSLFAANE